MPCRFIPGERARGTHYIEGRLDPRTVLDDMEKFKFLTLPGLEIRPLSRSALASRYTDCSTAAIV
jgi:hypothetical protein